MWVINDTAKIDTANPTERENATSQKTEEMSDSKSTTNDESNDLRVNDRTNFVSYIPPQGYLLIYEEGNLHTSSFGYTSPDYKEGVLPEGVIAEPCIEKGSRLAFRIDNIPRLVDPEADLVARYERANTNPSLAEWYYLTVGGEKFVYRRVKDDAYACSGSDGSIIGYHGDKMITITFYFAGDYISVQDILDKFLKSIKFAN